MRVLLAALAAVSPLAAIAQHTPDKSHFEGVNKRGDHAMGFDHSKTTHHFRLYEDGGAINVEANNPTDTTNRNAIREHLKMIRGMFAAGNFKLPMFIHATTLPGMKTMEKLRKQIAYRYEETPAGAQVRLMTKSPKALTAIHNFLRFQIKDHRTGDSLMVTNR